MSYAVYSHAGASPTRRAYEMYDAGPTPVPATAHYGGGAPVAGPELHQQQHHRAQQQQQHRGYDAYGHDGPSTSTYTDAHYAHHPRTVSSGSGSDPRYHHNVAPHERSRTISNGINGGPSFRDQQQQQQQQQQHSAGIGSPAQLGHGSDFYPTYAEPYLSPGDRRPLHFRQTSSDSRLHLRQQSHPATTYASPGAPPLAMPVRTSSGLAGAPIPATTPSAAAAAADVHHSGPPAYAPSLKVLQWTPQRGEENTQVTIILDASAIRNARRSPFTGAPASFGPPGLSGHDPRAVGANRHFVVVFGQAPAATQFTRAQVIDGNGVGQSMSAGPNEEDAFVVLTTFVPPRARMGAPNERTMVVVQTVDVDSDACVESCIVGEWEPQQLYSTQPRSVTPRVHTLKRAGDELYSPRIAGPGSYRSGSEAIQVPPQNDWQRRSPGLMNNRESATPALASGASSHSNGYGHHEQEGSTEYGAQAAVTAPAPVAVPTSRHPPQPQLVRTSQISGSKAGPGATYSRKVVLKMQGDLNLMAMGWSNEEWTARRRLVQFWPQQDANVLNLAFRPIAQHEYVPNTIVVSCIFRDEWNECFVTSVDAIYLLEALVGARFSVEEKNRIRRNLEGFKPMTVSKSKADAEPFFKLIMGFPNPKPRNIEKDVKVFPWKILAQALKKVMSKYSANYPLGQDDPAYVHHEESPPKTPQTPTAPPSQSHVPSPHIIHTEASPRLGGDGSPRASPHVVTATPGSPFLEPPGHAGGASNNAHIGGFRSAPQSPYGTHGFRQSALDDSSFGSGAAFEPSYGSQKGLVPLSGSLSLDTVRGRNYSSFARPSHQAHLFPAAEDYGILASYSQPQLYSAEPPYEHQDARSDNGLGPSTSSLSTSQAHLRSVSEGLRPYSQTPQPRMPSPVELDSLNEVVGLPSTSANGAAAAGLDGRDGSLDSLRSHSHSQPHSHSPGSLLDGPIQTQSASE